MRPLRVHPDPPDVLVAGDGIRHVHRQSERRGASASLVFAVIMGAVWSELKKPTRSMLAAAILVGAR